MKPWMSLILVATSLLSVPTMAQPTLRFREALEVPKTAIRPEILQANLRRAGRLQALYFENNMILVDSRNEEEQMVISLGELLRRQRKEFCEISFIPKVEKDGKIYLNANMRLDYYGQGGVIEKNRLVLAYRIYQQADKYDFKENEITSISCTTSDVQVLTSGEFSLSVLQRVLGPNAQIENN